MNNSVFGETMENVRNHKDIKLVTSDKRRQRLVSEPDFHSYKKFSDHLVTIEIKKTFVKMIKPLYLGCMFLSCHVRVSSESTLYSCLNVKWPVWPNG